MYLTLWTLRVTPVYVYRHFSRWLRTRGNPAGTRKVATLPRVPAFDHANPWEGLRVAPKMCNFSSRSVARPRQSIVIFDTSRRTVGKKTTLPRAPAFDHAIPWEGLRVTPKMCNFTSRSVARPRQSIVIFDTWHRTVGKRCNFTSRSCVRPCQSMGKVARGADKVPFYDAFARSTTPIHGKGCIPDR